MVSCAVDGFFGRREVAIPSYVRISTSMRTIFENALKSIREFIGKMSRKDRIRAVIFAAAIIVLAIVIVAFLSRTTYETLFAGDPREAADVYRQAQEMGIQGIQIDGIVLRVPSQNADDVRSMLQDQGFQPDMSLLEQAGGFGTTEDHRRVILNTLNSEQIKHQILQVEFIQDAIVNSHAGQTSPFAQPRGNREASASVMLIVREGRQLTNAEAQRIADIVRGSMPGIAYENISITDNNLNHYPVGEGAEDLGVEGNSRIALRNYLSEQIRMQGLQLLEPVFGSGRIKIEPNLVLNWDTVVEEHVEYFPPIAGEMDGIVRSASELFETQLAAGAAAGIPGTDNNLNPPEYPYGPLADGEEYRRVLNEYNFEINQTITQIERERGNIVDVSIGVLIDSRAVTEDYSAEVKNLVSMGFGVNPDKITVATLPFSEEALLREAELQERLMELERQQRIQAILETVIMWAVILLLGIMLMSLVRTIVKSAKPELFEEPALAEGEIDYLAGDDIEGVPPGKGIELTTKSTSLQQIEEFIEKDAAAVAQLLRNWLTDE